jgi:hypothetical protein
MLLDCVLPLPIVAVQISPGDPAPALEERLLGACSAGLKRARCVAARSLSHAEESEAPQAVAVVSWDDAEHATIEVGLGVEHPVWLQRKIGFNTGDPELERWRAAGFTVALLVDDPRFWSETPPPAEPRASVPMDVAAPLPAPAPRKPATIEFDLRGLTGAGLVSGAWRMGAELRTRVALSDSFFATGSADYALAREAGVDVRWFDAALGAGWYVPRFWSLLESRIRVEVLAENLAATTQRATATDRRSAWIPGLTLGTDLLWPLGPGWALSARVDGFWLDGSTVITDAGERVLVSAGAGILLGLGASAQF